MQHFYQYVIWHFLLSVPPPWCSFSSLHSKPSTWLSSFTIRPINQHCFKNHYYIITLLLRNLRWFQDSNPQVFALILDSFSDPNLLSKNETPWLVLASALILLIMFPLFYPPTTYPGQVRSKGRLNSTVMSLSLIRVTSWSVTCRFLDSLPVLLN